MPPCDVSSIFYTALGPGFETRKTFREEMKKHVDEVGLGEYEICHVILSTMPAMSSFTL
jgi:hypothetical protein